MCLKLHSLYSVTLQVLCAMLSGLQGWLSKAPPPTIGLCNRSFTLRNCTTDAEHCER